MALLVGASGFGAFEAKCRIQPGHTEKSGYPAGQRLLGDAKLFGNVRHRAPPGAVQAQRD